EGRRTARSARQDARGHSGPRQQRCAESRDDRAAVNMLCRVMVLLVALGAGLPAPEGYAFAPPHARPAGEGQSGPRIDALQPTIRWQRQNRSQRVTVELIGADPALLRALPAAAMNSDQWTSIFKVVVASRSETPIAILGSYRLVGDSVTFEP